MKNVKIDEMEEGKEKELMNILADGGKPYVKKQDGYAIKVSEDKEITYRDYSDNELTLKVPAGSYIVSEGDGCYPKIVTAEDFESKNKFIGGEEKKSAPERQSPKIGIESIENY